MLPKKYLQQINNFQLSIADPHTPSLLTSTEVMSQGLMLLPFSSLRHPLPCNTARALETGPARAGFLLETAEGRWQMQRGGPWRWHR